MTQIGGPSGNRPRFRKTGPTGPASGPRTGRTSGSRDAPRSTSAAPSSRSSPANAPALGPGQLDARQHTSPRSALARIGGRTLSVAQLDERALALGLFDQVAEALRQLATELGLEPPASDDAGTWRRFQEKLLRSASAQGRGSEARKRLSEALDGARTIALHSLVAELELPAELRRRGREIPADAKDNLPALQELLLADLAEELHDSPDSDAVASAFNRWLTTKTDEALWAGAGLDTQPADTARPRAALVELYARRDGLGAYRRVASELASGGPARELLELMAKEPSLEQGYVSRRTLELLAGAPGAPSWLQGPLASGSGSNLFELDLGPSGPVLGPTAGKVPEELLTGKRTVTWTRGPDGKPLAQVAAVQGDGESEQRIATWLAGEVTRLARELAQLLASQPPPEEALGETARRLGLTSLLGDRLVEVLLAHPGIRVAIAKRSLRQALTGVSPEQHSASLARLFLPENARGELTKLFDQARALNAAHPLPPHLVEGLVSPAGRADEALVELPLQEGAHLSAAQQSALAAIQAYLMASGDAPPGSLTLGALDAGTLRKLRGFAANPAGPFVLTPRIADSLLRTVAARTPVEKRLLGELLLSHPVATRAGTGERRGDAAQLVLAYLQEQGFPVPAATEGVPLDPAKIDPIFLSGLSASAAQPVDPAALERARERLRRQDAPGASALLSLPVLVGGPAGARVYLPTGPLSPSDTTELQRQAVARLFPTTLEQVSRKVARADEGLVATDRQTLVRLGRPGLDSLPVREPIAALKLFVARAQGRPPPVASDHSLQATLTGDELDALRPLLGPLPAATEAAWKEVASLVRSGRVVLANLREVPAKDAVSRNVNKVLEGLRHATHILSLLTLPEDAAALAAKDPLTALRPLSPNGSPLADGRQVLAEHFHEKPQDASPDLSALGPDDLDRLLRLEPVAREAEGEPLGNQAILGQRFRASLQRLGGELVEVRAALAAGRLRIRQDGVWAADDADGMLRAKATRVRDCFLEGADWLRTRSREQAEHGWAGRGERAVKVSSKFLFRLNFFADAELLNHVTDWSLTALRKEMHEQEPARHPDPSLPAPLRRARNLIDRNVLDYLIRSGGDGSGQLARLAAAMAEGRVAPWEPQRYPRRPTGTDLRPEVAPHLREVRGEGDPAIASAKEEAMRQVDLALEQALQKNARVTPEMLRFLVERHGDLLGKSHLATLLSGTPLPLPGPEEAKKLLLEVADTMPPEGWETLNLTLGDASATEGAFNRSVLAKVLVQSALDRLGAVSTSHLLAGRDAAELKNLASVMFGLPATTLAPFLKGHMLQRGFLDAQEVGALDDRRFSPAHLRAAALMAENAAHEYDSAQPEVAKALRDAQGVLLAAADHGAPVELTDGLTHSTAASRALRTVAQHATAARGALRSVGEVPLLSFSTLLPDTAELELRSPPENIVLAGEPQLTLAEASRRLGQTVPAITQVRRELRNWGDRAHFGPGRALETGTASAALFWKQLGLMSTLIHHQVYGKSVLETARAAVELSDAQTPAERQEAVDRAAAAWQEALNLTVMKTAFLTVAGPLEDVADQVAKGNLDVAAGRAYAFYATMPGLFMASRHLFAKALSHARTGALLARDLATGRPAAQLGLLSQQLVGARPAKVASAVPSGSLGRTLVARSYAVAAALVDTAVDPRIGWQAVGAGLSSLTRPLRPGRQVHAGTSALELTLSPEDKRFLVEHAQDGRFSLKLETGQGGTARPLVLSIPNSALVELAHHAADKPGQPLGAELAKRLGLDGLAKAQSEQLAGALTRMVAGLDTTPAASSPAVPSLRELSSDGRARESLKWEVSHPGQPSAFITLQNRRLVELAAALNRSLALDPSGGLFALELDRFPELAGYSPEQVRAIVERYAQEYRTWGPLEAERLKGQVRVAQVEGLDAPLPALETPLAIAPNAAASELYRARVDGIVVSLRRSATSGGEVGAFDEAGKDISTQPAGQKLLERFRGTVSRYALKDDSRAPLLMRLEAERAAFSNELAALQSVRRSAEPPAPEQLKQRALELHDRFQAWLARAQRELTAGVSPQDVAGWKARLKLPALRAAIVTQSLQIALEASKLGTASLRLSQGALRTATQAAKSPSYQLLVLLEGKEYLYELGDVWNDATADKLDKAWGTVSATAGLLGRAALAGGALATLDAVLPRFARVLRSGGAVGLLASAADGSLLAWVPGAIAHSRGWKNPLDATRAWRQLGLPESAYFKIEPELYAPEFVHARLDNDLEGLGNNTRWTRRMNFWFAESSSLWSRLAPLGQLPRTETEGVFLQPDKVVAAKAVGYQEPAFRTWEFLERLPELRVRYPELARIPGASTFEPKSFAEAVSRETSEHLMRRILEASGEGPPEELRLELLDPVALAGYLERLDRDTVRPLSPSELEILGRRIETEVDLAQRWTALLYRMPLSPEARREALKRLVLNLASLHVVNRMMNDLSTQRRGGAPLPDSLVGVQGVDDAYLTIESFR